VRIILIIILLGLSSCGFKPMLAKDSNSYEALNKVKIVDVSGQDHLRIKRIIEESFVNNPHTTVYDLKINVSYSVSSMGVMTDSQITRYRVNVTLHYTLLDSETQKILDNGAILLRSSYDSEGSDFANFVAERNVGDNVLRELSDELKTRLMLVISELEENGQNSH